MNYNYLNDMLVSWFFSGSLKGPRGTWGSLASLPFAYILWKIGGSNLLLIASVVVLFVGIIVCDNYVKRTGEKDPSYAVIDEVAGQWLALTTLSEISLMGFLIGFILFRFFDITKIEPAKKLESLEGGLGIMLDDIVAGIYAAACLYFIQYYFPQIFIF